MCFRVLFLKIFIFKIVAFFLTQCLSIQHSFSVAVVTYEIHDFDEAFFFLAAVAMITENVTFISFHCKHCKENKFFHHNHAPFQSKLSFKKWSQTEKCYSKKLLQRCIFNLIAKDLDPNDGVKMQQILLSWILLSLFIYRGGFDLFNMYYFS